MLQQTQVDRVIPKYRAFIKTFPTAKRLAAASLADVLKLWSGLGYNRRAKYLHEAAKLWGGVPLEDLPGVGPYTASAVRVFAYNEPVNMIETNIRTVIIHHCFSRRNKVSDIEILQLTGILLSNQKVKKDPRTWYSALMDYGSYLKKIHTNPSRLSSSPIKQQPFKGSDRAIRGAILRAHLAGTPLSKLPFLPERVHRLEKILKQEKLI